MAKLSKQKLTEELYTLVGEIEDPEIRSFVVKMLVAAPLSFWERRASENHHLEDERGPHGNLLHTVRVTKLVKVICDVLSVQTFVCDLHLSRAILHDLCRYGLDSKSDHTVPNHPWLVRELASKCGATCFWIDVILTPIEHHMGKWGNPPFQISISNDAVLHLADSIEARIPEFI